MRQVVDTLIVLVILAIGTHSFLVAGWLAPIVVGSGSMGPNLPGPHRDVVCRACGLPFACDALALPASGLALCPNCWFGQNDLANLPDRAGDRLIVDRAAWTFLGPGRWQKFVLANPDNAKTWIVKRVVGLPGEEIEFREGDVWIDGRRASKSLKTLREMAILVHDDSHRPDAQGDSHRPAAHDDSHRPAAQENSHRPAAPDGADGNVSMASCGWRPDDAGSRWRRTDRGWTWQTGSGGSPAEPASGSAGGPDRGSPGVASQPESAAQRGSPLDSPDRFDWLVYHHCQSPALHSGVATPGPILDDDAYNQAESRELRPVRDLVIRFRATLPADVDLAARLGDVRDGVEIVLRSARGVCELRRRPAPRPGDGRGSPKGDDDAPNDSAEQASFDASTTSFDTSTLRSGATIEFAECDGRIFAAIDGRVVLDGASAHGDSAVGPDAARLAIGLCGGADRARSRAAGVVGDATMTGWSAAIDELRVLRDVYYLPSAEGTEASAGRRRLGPEEYFLLGDNSPRSLDSRHWPPGSASRSQLVGRVIGVLAPPWRASAR